MTIAKRIELLLMDPNEDLDDAAGRRIRDGLTALKDNYDLIVHKKELETIDFLWDDERPYNFLGQTYEAALEAVREDRKPEPGSTGKICGYDLEDLVLFANACKERGISESEMRGFANNVQMAMAYVTDIYSRQYIDAWQAMVEKEKENENKDNGD